ncbi:tRNA (adenosine(37)-N6)-threonylcarbamoyltransferase complex ATPase subunit type 1 TsaE [Acholeplasma equirhinis]|uniref:tRNA (adenosine(37)-N6)-threonylcarbamoyltransferase complex ATPase subunit type 1 TsaE n=1 Tax=Acholeplasma equirhinis TaxID=555393 RepID=UPI00197ABD92|nr:tRNA (adenosine(37)-N6)-threonylcarbamoyltransferase complex ATPase subunit type 1 TsaE [Acholeplasma equirhinis]MBN3490990.1 tRNA (adenosine(37)-N6)-threonylcarbamoyltransferase complex ATPase subunit type 1 TsaE [Acholeplasma equirhinis]
MRTIYTNSSEETIELGYNLIKQMPHDCHVVLLSGDLSAGKTTLTKGIAKALNVKSIINSPTFTILKVHKGDKTLYHFDLYRMDKVGTDFDLEEYIDDPNSLAVIEWPYQVKELLPQAYVEVKLTYIKDNEREIVISSVNMDDSWENNL